MENIKEIFFELELNPEIKEYVIKFIESPENKFLEKIPPEIQKKLCSYLLKASGVQHLLVIKKYGKNKEIQKEAGKGLHILRSKGLKFETPEEKKTWIFSESFYDNEPEEPLSIVVFPPSAFHIIYYLYIEERATKTSYVVVAIFINSYLESIDLCETCSKKNFFLDSIKKLLNEKKILYAEIPPQWTKYRIIKGIEKLKETEKFIDRYLDIQYILSPLNINYKHPVDEFFSENEISEIKNLLIETSKLFEYPEFEYWEPDDKTIKEIGVQIDKVNECPIALTNEQREEFTNSLIEKIILKFYNEEKRINFSEILKECAYIYFKNGEGKKAKLCLSSAFAFEDFNLDIMNHPFARALFMRKIFFKPKGGERKKERKRSRIILP